MNRRAVFVLVCVCLLVPSMARADDGGWLDWLYRLDAKFWGVNTEIHALCLDERGNRVRCEEWFRIPSLFGEQPPIDFKQIKHELNLRVGLYWSYGDLKTKDPLQRLVTLANGLKATKLMLMYAYLPDDHIEVGLGGGLLHFRGDDLVESQSSAILTPLSIVYVPARAGSWWSTFFVRGEASYISHTLTPNLFRIGAPGNGEGEWNVSLGTGFDFRRRPRPRP
jgi:hypothetical protein